MKSRSISFALVVALAGLLAYLSITAVNAAPQPPVGGTPALHSIASPTIGCGSLSFTQTNYQSANGDGAVKAGDFNGDGKPDLALISYEGSVDVMLNNGSGGLGAPTTYVINGAPVNLGVADLNGDGHLDIVLADPGNNNPQANFVAVLLGRGDGTFQAAAYYATGYYPNWVGIADFNGDGKLDIVTTNNGDGTVSLLPGSGNGTFGTATNITTGLWVPGVSGGAVGDFNNDGHPDVLVADESSSSLDLLLGNGDGTFHISHFAADRGVSDVIAADLDHDGKLDTISNNLYGNVARITVMRGDGAGNLGLPIYTNYPIYDGFALGDMNNDGNLDLVTDNYPSNLISVMLGNGAGEFAAPLYFDVGAPPDSIAIADLNSDGLPDLIASAGTGIVVLINTCGEVTGTPSTPTPTSTPYPTAIPPPSPTPCPVPFTDIAGNPFYSAIQYLYCARAVNGFGTEYRPAQIADRGQFAKLLVLGLGVYYSDGPQYFSDVPNSNYAAKYINSAYVAGLVNGYDAATCAANGAIYPCYLPQTPMRRGQLTKLVVRASYLPLVTPPQPIFSDVPPGSTFYTYVETAYLNGLVSGYPDGTFHPNQTIRRDEMAQIVYAAAMRAQRYPMRQFIPSTRSLNKRP